MFEHHELPINNVYNAVVLLPYKEHEWPLWCSEAHTVPDAVPCRGGYSRQTCPLKHPSQTQTCGHWVDARGVSSWPALGSALLWPPLPSACLLSTDCPPPCPSFHALCPVACKIMVCILNSSRRAVNGSDSWHLTPSTGYKLNVLYLPQQKITALNRKKHDRIIILLPLFTEIKFSEWWLSYTKLQLYSCIHGDCSFTSEMLAVTEPLPESYLKLSLSRSRSLSALRTSSNAFVASLPNSARFFFSSSILRRISSASCCRFLKASAARSSFVRNLGWGQKKWVQISAQTIVHKWTPPPSPQLPSIKNQMQRHSTLNNYAIFSWWK